MKKIVTAIVLAMLIFAFAACGQNGEEGTTDNNQKMSEVNLKIALFCQKEDSIYRAVEQFVGEIGARTDGAIQAEIVTGKDAGSEQEIVDALFKNAAKADMTVVSRDIIAKYEPKMNISALPYLFADYDEAMQFLHGDIQKEAEKNLSNQNIKVLAHYAEGFHCLTLKKMYGNDIKDLQGSKIVTTGGKYNELSMKAMGASVDNVEAGNLRNILRQNPYDGFEGMPKVIYEKQLYQMQKSLLVTRHTYEGSCFIMDNSLWNKLSEEHREIIEKAAFSSAYMQFEKTDQEEKRLFEQMQSAGVRVFHPSQELFWEKAQPVIKGLSSEFDSLTDQIISWKNGK